MGRLLTFRRARTYALLFIALYLVAWIYELRSGSPPVYGDNVPIGGDYIAFHAAGRLLLYGHGADLYDRSTIITIQDELLEGRVPGFYDAFRNPPFAALPFVPLAALELVPGFIIWTAVNLAALGAALWLLLHEMPSLKPRWRGILVLVLAFAPVYFGLIDGQNAPISLLLYVLIYRALRRDHDRSAAFWAALGLFKPQLFLVFPLILIARRSWRGVLVYTSTAAALLLVSFVVVGIDGLRAWLRIVIEPESGQVLVNTWRMVSLKSFLDGLLGPAPALALGLYLVVSAVLLGAVFMRWSHPGGSPQMRWIFTSLVAVLVDPHLVDYDLTVLVLAGILVVIYAPGLRWWLVPLYVVLVVRAQIPLGDNTLQASTLLLLGFVPPIWKASTWSSASLSPPPMVPLGIAQPNP